MVEIQSKSIKVQGKNLGIDTDLSSIYGMLGWVRLQNLEFKVDNQDKGLNLGSISG